MSNNQEWTYATKLNQWLNKSYPTKEDAILYGRCNTDHKLYAGQLVEYAELEYVVDNVKELLV